VRPDSQVEDIKVDWAGREAELPEVTLRLVEWLFYCPASFRARIADCTAAMSDRMAAWADRNWLVTCEEDLDIYTFAVAGAVGLVLCEIWEWFEGTKTDRGLAIGYGRGLQSVNILRNSGEDLERGVTFYPPGWTQKEVPFLARR
jgi:farnesyl-diphosphate farnesyltransferase